MSGPLVKLAVLIALTHLLRVLGRLAGPRRSGLALGLPSTTAIALVSCGWDRGFGDASAMAEACLLALVAAATVPLVFARGLARGRPLFWTLAAALSAYPLVAGLMGNLAMNGGVGCVGLATLGVLAACALAGRIPLATAAPGRFGPSAGRSLVLRTVVPAASLLMVLALQDAAGPRWAGLLSPFPALTLAVLVTTHLESGPGEASRLARSLPAANLAMIGFLATFRFGGEYLGLGPATAAGYACALGTLALVELLAAHRTRWKREPLASGRPRSAGWRWEAGLNRSHAGASSQPSRGPWTARRRPAQRLRFSPWVEPLFP